MKKLLQLLGLVLLGLIIALALVPFLFKDQIIAKVQDYANENIHAELSFSDIGLGVFKSFPNASVDIEDLKIVGIEEFKGTPLFSAKNLALEMNIVDLIKNTENITVKEIHLQEPNINILVLDNGKANYDITKSTEESSSSNEMKFKLNTYSISEGNFTYEDRTSDLKFETLGFNQTGNGDFTMNNFELQTENNIEAINLSYGRMPYINKLPLKGDLDVLVDLNNSKYTISKSSLATNGIHLDLAGFVQNSSDEIIIDTKMSTNKGNFNDYLALLPGFYSSDVASYKTGGTASFDATIKGSYNGDKNIFPAIDVKLLGQDGSISGAEIPAALNAINFDLDIEANKSDWSDMKVVAKKLDFECEGIPTTSNFIITNVMSNPHIKGAFDGNVNLGSISSLVDLGDMDINKGSLKGNVTLDASQSDIENSNYENIDFKGDIVLDDFDANYNGESIAIEQSQIQLSPKQLQLKETSGKYGKSDFKVHSEINNPLAYVMTDKSMSGHIDFSSNYFDATPFLAETEDSDVNQSPEEIEGEDILLASNFDYKVNINTLEHPDYKISNVSSSGKLGANQLKLNKTTAQVDGTNYQVSGELENMYDYLYNNEVLVANLNVVGDEIDLNAYESEGTDEQEAGYIYLPENIQSNIKASFDKITYDKTVLNNFNGVIDLKDEKAMFKDMKADVFSGQLGLDGEYNSNTEDNIPTFQMKYDINNMKWAQAYDAFNTFKVLAPIGKFIDGVFNIDFEIGGAVNEEMYPDLSSITSKGFIHTLDAALKGFTPLESVGQALGIKALNTTKITDTKNWFEIRDGKIFVEPFDFKVDDMNFNIKGNHSIKQEIDYVMKAAIPRELLRNNNITNVADQGIKYLENEASKKGINLNTGDFIYLDIQIGGSITKPKVKVIPTGSGGQSIKDVLKNEVNEAKDKLVDTIRQTVNTKSKQMKDSILNRTTELQDKAKEKITEEKDKALDKGKEVVKSKVEEVIDSSALGSVKDSISSKIDGKVNDVLDGKVDDIKDKVSKWNPFKKGGGGRE